MLKRFTVALAAFFVLATQTFAAGTIPLSLSQQFDKFGHVLAGCKLNIIQAGTVGTPQIAYQDTALTISVPGGSQLTCDAAGRISQFFLADGNIKVQLTDANGVLQFTADNILVIGNSSGGGGGSPVDPTTILATGDFKLTYGTGILTGFVRANGRTIGSSTSGATERANSDCQALFQYLWGADPNLAVSTGRGASANADWVANKQLTLPDWRGQAIGALADMGNSATTLLTSTYFGTDPTALGAAGGLQSYAPLMANLPASPAPVSAVTAQPQLTNSLNAVAAGFGGASTNIQNGTGSAVPVFTTDKFAVIAPMAVTTNTANLGSGTPLPTVGPLKLLTIYVKL